MYLQKKIEKRGRKLVDFDSQRHSFQSLQNASKKKDDIKVNVSCGFNLFQINLLRQLYILDKQGQRAAGWSETNIWYFKYRVTRWIASIVWLSNFVLGFKFTNIFCIRTSISLRNVANFCRTRSNCRQISDRFTERIVFVQENYW